MAGSKGSNAGNTLNSAQLAGGRKMSHSNQSADMFHSMGVEQFTQRLLLNDDAPGSVKAGSLVHAELGPLDLSEGGQRQLRQSDRSSKVLAMNKKLIKPLTGNKVGSSQQSLVFPGPAINSLVQGPSDAGFAESSRLSDQRPSSSEKVPQLNFLSTGSHQHQSQKIRIPKHALANVKQRNPADNSQKGSFVSQRSANNKSISQQKHAKKNN